MTAVYPKATELFVASGGETLLGVLHLPATPGPHPVVVLLHGFPGNPCNVELWPHRLSRAGYAAVAFHYRGSYGVGGTWSFAHLLADVDRVLDEIHAPSIVDVHHLDLDRVALAGHSLGGFVALMAAAGHPSVAAVASVAGFDLSVVSRLGRADPVRRASFVELFASDLMPPRSPSGEALVAEVEAAGPAWSLAGLAPRLAHRPVLLAGASDLQGVTPTAEHHAPLVAAFQAHPVPRLEHAVVPAGSGRPGERATLADVTFDFLNRHLRPVPAPDHDR